MLRENLDLENKESEKWTKDIDNQLNKYLDLLYQNERNLLPNKRRRALDIAEALLVNIHRKLIMEGKASGEYYDTLQNLLKVFKTEEVSINDNESIDYYKFADIWIEEVFNHRLRELKNAAKMKKQKRTIYLENLRNDDEIKKRLTFKKLKDILDNVPVISNIWKNVTSCIIGIPKPID